MAIFGQLQAFNPDTDSVTAYIERDHLFFAANEIPDKKTVAVFLSTIGGKTYELLRNLVSPKPPESLKLSELTDILKLHYEPQPLVIAERFQFHRRFQTADESIAEFMAQLRRLSKHCDFQDYLEQALRDRLVCGLGNEGIQRRLLAEAKLTLAPALEIAQGMEAAERNAQSLKGSEAAVHKMNTSREPATQRPPTRAPCYRGGRATHDPKDWCRHRESVCHFCKKKGYIAPVCRFKQQQGAGRKPDRRSSFNRSSRSRPQQTKYVSAKEDTSDTELPIYAIGESSSRPLRTDVLVNGKRLSMEIDTGAAVSIISEHQKKLHFPDATLAESSVQLRTYTLITDHKPLMAILESKKGIPPLAAARLQRWAILLAAYDYQVEFRDSLSHANADGLSRLPLRSDRPAEYSSEPTIFNISQIEAIPVTAMSIRQATSKDPIFSKVLHHTKQGWPSPVPESLQALHAKRNEISIEDDCLLWGIRVIIPKALRRDLLQELHRDHPGISRMKSLARSHIWWPGLDSDVEQLAKSCQACKSVKQAQPVAPLHPWTWPSKPWQRVHIDFAGPFLNKMYFLVVDAHSKWPETFEMTQTTTTKTVSLLRHLFAKYGLPEQVVSDNGPQFTSDEFAQFMCRNGIRQTRSSPYHPSSNGAVERFVRTFKQTMKAGEKDGLSHHHRLANFLLTYRTTPHSTTQVAPCTLFLGRSIRSRLDLVRPDVSRQVCLKQDLQKRHHDRHAHERNFMVGQRVTVRNYRPGPAWIPGTITQAQGPLTFIVCMENGQLWKRHVDQLKSLSTRKPTTEFTIDGNQDAEHTPADSVTPSEPTRSQTTTGTGTSPSPPSPSPSADQDRFALSGTSRYPRRDRHPPDRLMM